MNMLKGIDRIIPVLADFAIVIGVVIGTAIVEDTFKIENPEYPDYISPYDQDAPPKYIYPSKWKYLAGGVVGSLFSYFFVLYGFKAMTRGIRWLFLWIATGFKDNVEKAKQAFGDSDVSRRR